MRLDKFLVENKFYETRNKAQNAIHSHLIKVNNIVIDAPHYFVRQKDVITKIEDVEYVSRGAYKLLAAIEKWKLNFDKKVILDVGSSTGGFTDVAIKHGAKFVYAVDVGTNQLHYSLINHKKIKSLENTHFKNLTSNLFNHRIDIVVADLSFISLTKLMDKLVNLLKYKYQCVFLIKPEFELSPQEIKKGKVNNPLLLKKAINKIIDYADTTHFKVLGVMKSPIKGNKAGNTEYLIYMEKI